MRISKRNKYLNGLYCAIHTMMIGCKSVDLDCVKEDIHTKQGRKKADGEYTFIVNPNKGRMGDHAMITSYKGMQEILERILDEIQCQNAYLIRSDISFNSDTKGDFDLYKKLNRLILCCLAESEGLKNCYQSKDLWTLKDLNIAVKNNSIEIENYDKEEESHGSVPTTNRLELRSKSLHRTDQSIYDRLQEEFLSKWMNRLDRCSSREIFEQVQARYNDNLAKLYAEDLLLPKREREYVSLTAFLMAHRDCIFTSKQLEDLLSRFSEVQCPKNRAKKFKESHSIEFFSLKDIQIVISGLKNCMKQYFEN